MRTVRFSARPVVAAVLLVVLVSTSVADTWHYLSGGKLSGISSVGSHVWTVGQDGLFFYSEDNGQYWRRVPRFTERDLMDVEFWDYNFGLITAEGDIVYRTTDNGATWDSSCVTGGRGKIRFITRDVVWITRAGSAAFSADGALTWEARTCPAAGPHWFSDSLNGWAAEGRRVFRTSDGGRNWAVLCSLSSEYYTNYIAALAFAGKDRGVLLRYIRSYGGHIQYDDRVWYTTTDGGESWFSGKRRSGYPSPSGLDVDDSGRICVLENDICTVFEISYHRANPFDTLGSETNPSDVSAVRGDYLWVCGSGSIVQMSTNHGVSWTAVRPGNGGQMRNIAFFDSTQGLGISQWTTVSTTNGGRTWVRVLPARRQVGSGFVGLCLVPPASAYVTRDDVAFHADAWWGYFDILASRDRGVHWAIEYTEDWWVCRAGAICFANSSHGWHPGNVAQQGASSVRTSNGGDSWVTMPIGVYFYSARSVCFPDTLHGWFVHPDGSVYRTASGGDSWYLQWSGTPLKRMQMLNLEDGWALADAGLTRTTNGGDSWTLAFAAGGLNAFHFANEQHGVAVGQQCRIFHTADSGHTWVRDTCAFTSNLNAVFMLDSTHAWAAGDNGLVLGFGDWAIGVDERISAAIPPNRTGIKFWPNPCRNAANVLIGRSGRFRLQVYDAAGRLVMTQKVERGSVSQPLDLRSLPSGVYFASILPAARRETVRLVKVE